MRNRSLSVDLYAVYLCISVSVHIKELIVIVYYIRLLLITVSCIFTAVHRRNAFCQNDPAKYVVLQRDCLCHV